jgi:hypothetical protein
MMNRSGLFVALLAIGCLSEPVSAQMTTEIPPVVAGARAATLEKIKVHGSSLEGNLEGNSADRDVLIFLPPGYREQRNRRYPVVYALHGYSKFMSRRPSRERSHRDRAK